MLTPNFDEIDEKHVRPIREIFDQVGKKTSPRGGFLIVGMFRLDDGQPFVVSAFGAPGKCARLDAELPFLADMQTAWISMLRIVSIRCGVPFDFLLQRMEFPTPEIVIREKWTTPPAGGAVAPESSPAKES